MLPTPTMQCKTAKDANRPVGEGVPCRFPFIYKGVLYEECVWDEKGAWCSTNTDNSNKHIAGSEGACSSNCPILPSSTNTRTITNANK